MPPTARPAPRFAAEPPQDLLPYGRWAETLRAEFLAACLRIDAGEDDLGEPEGEIAWFPDRTYGGRTHVPATVRTTTGLELYGHVSFVRGDGDGEPRDFAARADFTPEVAEQNPDWALDLSEDELGTWRGEVGTVAMMALVWGAPLVRGGAIVTAELGAETVDQCELVDGRFTLIAPDAYRGDYLEIALWNQRGEELARESLYAEDDEDQVQPGTPGGDGGS